jgi:tetratricopeptide (TPR) repeat protein
MKVLAYIQSKDERSIVRPLIAKKTKNLLMINSPEELCSELKSKDPIDLIILDDSIDAKTVDGATINKSHSVLDLLDAISKNHPQATLLTILRPSPSSTSNQGISTDYVDSSIGERMMSYIEKGCFFYIEHPCAKDKIENKIETVFSYLEKPPPWFKALEQIYLLYSQGHFSDCLAFIEKMESNKIEAPQCLFEILRAKTLFKLGDDFLAQSLASTLEIQTENPECPYIASLIVDLLRKIGKHPIAFSDQLGVFSREKSVNQFNKCLSILEECFTERPKIVFETPQQLEQMLLNNAEDLLNLLNKEPLHSKKFRAETMNKVKTLLSSEDSYYFWLSLVQKMPDIILDVASSVEEVIYKIEDSFPPRMNAKKEALNRYRLLYLEHDPSNSRVLENAINLLLETNKNDEAENLLKRAEDSGAKSLEFYTLLARLRIIGGYLKEASELLHKATKLSADDTRVTELRALWQTAYESKQATS